MTHLIITKQPSNTHPSKPVQAQSPAQRQEEGHPTRASTPSQLLGWQRAVGNRAVLRMLADKARSPRSSLLIQRWEGPEHARLGNATGMQINLGNGVVLDWGQVVAIAGDEVGTLEELQDLVKTDEGKAKICAMLESAEVAGNGAQLLPAPSPDQKKEQQNRYFTLLLDNLSHFQSGEMALDTWRGYHYQALNLALRAGITNPVESSPDLNQAYLTEAFGQHFLTDMFSAGHIRTPRSEIYNYYVNTFAPKVIDTMIARLKERFVDGVYQQVRTQSWKARWFEGKARDKIRNGINDMIKKKMDEAKMSSKDLTETFGKALAGVISGAIHDAEGKRGTWVSSVVHPEPWQAFGDSRLDEKDNATNKDQAELAVKAGLGDIQRAYELGQHEGAFKATVPTPDRIPSRVYFKFNSDAIEKPAVEPIRKAAAYLAYNPGTHLELTGHTDPIGSAEFNDGLGMRRAESVVRDILGESVPASQVNTTSMGKSQLATTNPRQYNLDRRVEFGWTSRPDQPGGGSTDPAEIAFQRASQALSAQVGPPYHNVEDFIPHAVDNMNPALPDWHWESMSYDLKLQINEWVKHRFTPDLQATILNSDKLGEQTIEGFKVNPKPIVEALLKEINADPMVFLTKLFYMEPPSDQDDDMDAGVD